MDITLYSVIKCKDPDDRVEILTRLSQMGIITKSIDEYKGKKGAWILVLGKKR